jgi:hypothetical protein
MLRSARPGCHSPYPAPLSRLPGRPGQREGQGRALALDALHAHLPAVRCDHLLHQVEAQPGASRLRRVQGLKKVDAVRGRDATARIWLGKEMISLSPPPRRTGRAGHLAPGSSNLRTPKGALML